MLRIGLSSCGYPLNEQSFEGLKNSGITDIEVVVDYGKYEHTDFGRVGSLAKEYGIGLWSFHLPFCSPDHHDISSTDPQMKRISVERCAEYIKKGSDIGIDKFVIHPSSEPVSLDPVVRAEHIKNSMDSLDFLANLAYSCGATIAVETLPRSCLGRNSEEMITLLGANDKLRICLDVNHLLIEKHSDFIDRLGSKIITLHISDYDFLNERHWLPGEGDNDWYSLYRKLLDAGYSGVWMYEVRLACPDTIVRERDLRFDDFYRNAHEIFENRPITVLGKREEGLGKA